jgi:hypothetical protein
MLLYAIRGLATCENVLLLMPQKWIGMTYSMTELRGLFMVDVSRT